MLLLLPWSSSDMDEPHPSLPSQHPIVPVPLHHTILPPTPHSSLTTKQTTLESISLTYHYGLEIHRPLPRHARRCPLRRIFQTRHERIHPSHGRKGLRAPPKLRETQQQMDSRW